jgi:hypothetical protein
MKFSKATIISLIDSYLQDIEDFGDKTIYTPEYTTICESTLENTKKIILKSKNTSVSSLRDSVKNGTNLQKEVMEDFILYIKSFD